MQEKYVRITYMYDSSQTEYSSSRMANESTVFFYYSNAHNFAFGNSKQLNVLINEDESIGKDGEKRKWTRFNIFAELDLRKL